jgi:hypothetical protein
MLKAERTCRYAKQNINDAMKRAWKVWVGGLSTLLPTPTINK